MASVPHAMVCMLHQVNKARLTSFYLQEAAGIKADSVIAKRVDAVASRLRRRSVSLTGAPPDRVQLLTLFSLLRVLCCNLFNTH